MAIIKLGATVVGVRGTLGGLTYSANRSGPYIRQYQRYAPSATRAMANQAADMARLGGLWSGLGASGRSGWDTLAALAPEPHYNSLGEYIDLTGWAYFVMCNRRRATVGVGDILTAPTGAQADRPPPGGVTGVTMDIGGTPDVSATWADYGPETGDVMTWFSRALSGTSTVGPGGSGFFVAAEDAASLSMSVYDAFIARLGDIQDGWTCYITFAFQRLSGLKGVPFVVPVEVGGVWP